MGTKPVATNPDVSFIPWPNGVVFKVDLEEGHLVCSPVHWVNALGMEWDENTVLVKPKWWQHNWFYHQLIMISSLPYLWRCPRGEGNIYSTGHKNGFILSFDNGHEISILSGCKVMSFFSWCNHEAGNSCLNRESCSGTCPCLVGTWGRKVFLCWVLVNDLKTSENQCTLGKLWFGSSLSLCETHFPAYWLGL